MNNGNSSWGGRVTDEETPWYAVRLFTPRLREVADWMADAGIDYFIPMEYRMVAKGEGRPVRTLMPVVRNLIFLRKDREERQFRTLIASVPYKLSVVRKGKETGEYYEIPHRQMWEFQIMCNPEIELKRYLSEEEAKLKAGQPVEVKWGPLKGLTGKLVRASKKYYLLKEVPGVGVMIKVSRWCCVPIKSKEKTKNQ